MNFFVEKLLVITIYHHTKTFFFICFVSVSNKEKDTIKIKLKTTKNTIHNNVIYSLT